MGGDANSLNTHSCCELFVNCGLKLCPLDGKHVFCVGTAVQLWSKVALHSSSV